MSLLKYPYTNLHELNLDWIIEQLNQSGTVTSVNGKHGAVTLTGEDIIRTPNNQQTVEQALSSQGSSLQSVQTKIGVTPLPTTAQTITGAIAEHETDISGMTSQISSINSAIGSTPLPTVANTVTGAIAEQGGYISSLGGQIAITEVGSSSGTTPLALPANYKILFVVVSKNGRDFEFIIPKAHLTSNARYFREGQYVSSSDYTSCTIEVTESSIALASVGINGTDYTSATSFSVAVMG